MGRVLALLSFIVVSIAFACSSGDVDQERTSLSDIDPEDAITRSLAAMDDLTAYQMEFTFRPEGEPITFLVHYADPGDYYERLVEAPAGETETFEIILLGDKTYLRHCDPHPDGCDEWEESDSSEDRAVIPAAGGFTTVGPETLGLVAIEMTDKPRAIGDDNGLAHLRGTVNLSRAIYENQRRLLEQAKDLGDCEQFPLGSSSYYGTGTPIIVTPGPVTCRSITVEEALQKRWEGYDLDAGPPSEIDIWLSPKDFLVHGVAIKVSGDESRESFHPYFETSYSRFNEVTIEPPN